MKSIVSYTKFILVAVALVFASCKKDDKFAIIKSAHTIAINGNVNNLTIPGGIAAGAGAIAPFDVVVSGTDVTDVTITNRYTLPGSTTLKEFALGTFAVSGGKASVPSILVSTLRDPADPLIVSTATAGTNLFLIDAVLSNGERERRNFTVSLANSVIVIDGDIYKINIPATISAGVPSITILVSSTALGVRITSRYVLPNTSTAKNYTGGAVVYATTPVNATTNSVTIPAMALAQMRDPADNSPITDLSNVGQQFIVIDATSTAVGGTTLSSKTANIVW